MRNPVVGVVHSSRHGTVSQELAKDQIEFNCEGNKVEINKFVTFRKLPAENVFQSFG